MSTLHGLKRLPYLYLGLMPLAEIAEQAMRQGATRAELTKQTELLPLVRDAFDAGGGKTKVTVVLATYNRPELLARAVASLLAQTVTEWQCLVINDGGRPPTLPEDGRLRLLDLPSNVRNLAVLRNLGISAAGTPFVAFLDDDNEWLPHHLATLLSHMESCDCRIAYTYCQQVDGEGERLGVIGAPFSRRRLARYNFVDSNAILLRNQAGMSVPVMPRRRSSWRKEDWAFVAENARLGSVHSEPIVTVRYLVNPSSYYSSH